MAISFDVGYWMGFCKRVFTLQNTQQFLPDTIIKKAV